MKKIIAILILGSFLSCTDHFAELNTDKKSLATVPAESLFNNATERFYHIMNNQNVNTNVFRLYAQYLAQTSYPEESQYNMVTRSIPANWFARIYRDGLSDIKEAKRLLALVETNVNTAPIQKNKFAIMSITEVQMYSTLVDLFGNVPYSQALDFENPSPVYDDAATIYADLASKLDQAISDLDVNADSFSSNNDLVNQGNTAMWKKTANSLKLRMAMRLADVDPAKSKSMAESAVAGGVFSDMSEQLSMEYTTSSPYTHPAYEDIVLSGRADFVGSNTLVDMMNTLNDPRRAIYFDSNISEGFTGGTYGTANSYSSATHVGAFFNTADSPGIIMSCSEVEFLKAEGAARGYNMGGTAEELYNKAISTSIMELGGSQADADTYLAQESVAYSTAAGAWNQKIGIQKWISMFHNGGIEGWTAWRLLDFDGFNAPEGLTLSDIPTRLLYPVNEATLNGQSLSAAISAIGGNSKTGKIFWDKK
ncbi:MAG: hypothetical protein ACI9IP_000802 [Arcticibacterium sp.]|jgi:hypothetical protein